MPEYIVISIVKAKPEELAKHRKSHADYIESLKKQGILGIAGRFSDGGGGVYVLTLESGEDAMRIASADPYHSSGVREFTLREWERKY